MTNAAAIQASYSDFKLIKSRSQAQIVLEIPIENAEAFLKAFGVPQPGQEKPVAIALLRSSTDKPGQSQQTAAPEKGKRRFDELPRSQQAALMCDREDFQTWMQAADKDRCAELVRFHCRVHSRALLDSDHEPAAKWDDLLTWFRQQTGQMAEQRG